MTKTNANETEAQAFACPLLEFIELHFNGNQRAFALAQDVQPPQVTQWIQKYFIVVDGQLYSPRRELKTRYENKSAQDEVKE